MIGISLIFSECFALNRGLQTFELTLGDFTSLKGVVGISSSPWMEIMMLDLSVNNIGHEKINKWFLLFLPKHLSRGLNLQPRVTDIRADWLRIQVSSALAWGVGVAGMCSHFWRLLHTGSTLTIQLNAQCLWSKMFTLLDKLGDFSEIIQSHPRREFTLQRSDSCRGKIGQFRAT